MSVVNTGHCNLPRVKILSTIWDKDGSKLLTVLVVKSQKIKYSLIVIDRNLKVFDTKWNKIFVITIYKYLKMYLLINIILYFYYKCFLFNKRTVFSVVK